MDLNTISEVARPRGAIELPRLARRRRLSRRRHLAVLRAAAATDTLIDLGRLGWPPLDATPTGLEIAATCTIARARRDFDAPAGWNAAPLFGQCCRAFLASFKIWNAATVGGNICMSLPAGADDLAHRRARRRLHAVAARTASRARSPSSISSPATHTNVLAAGRAAALASICRRARSRKRFAFRQVSLTPLGRSAALLIGTRQPQTAAISLLTVTAATPRPVQLRFDAVPDGRRCARAIDDAIPADA